jgi:hypothetical protein
MHMRSNSLPKKKDVGAAHFFCPRGKEDEQLCDSFNHGQACYRGGPELASLMLDAGCNKVGLFDTAHSFPQVFMRREHRGMKSDGR